MQKKNEAVSTTKTLLQWEKQVEL